MAQSDVDLPLSARTGRSTIVSDTDFDEETKMYDAIVIGARCAGSPTAMLLARQGHRVLVVDRATFPSDTMSTHLIRPPGWPRFVAGACSTI